MARLFATARDVTAEVETAAFIQSIVQFLPSPLLVKSANKGRYALINRAAEDMLGRSSDELLGRTDEEVFAPAVAERTARLEQELLTSGGARSTQEQIHGLDGEVRQFGVKRIATYDDDGPRHLISIWEDVTEARASAASLKAALEAAEEADRAKNAFLTNISHEIRTPLNGVIAGAEMLASRALPPESRPLLEMIRASGRVLERLLSDLLDSAAMGERETAVRQTPFDLHEVMRSAAEDAGARAAMKGLAFSMISDLQPGLAVVGDAPRISQVLGHLLDNAVKFTDHGQISLGVHPAGGDRIRFEVEDTGVGFDEVEKEQLFDGFRQVDNSITRRFGGVGVGLTLSRRFVELMGGRMGCSGAKDVGARFWFELPLPGVDGGQALAARPVDEGEAPLRVLLADDHPTNRQIVEAMLADVAVVISVENGQEAVQAFQRDAPDIIIMDMQMPVMDGLAAVREIRRLEDGARRTPIIMLTANTLPEHVEAAAAAGADRHLGKPIRAATLFGAIDSFSTALAE